MHGSTGGLLICHRCDNRRCVLVAHMFLGTHADNYRDMVNKGRDRKARGDGHGRSKVTSADVRDMRRLNAEGISYTRLAKSYGLVKSTVAAAITGAHWAEVQ